MGYDAPFAGITVLDLSQGIAGPYCGMMLAQQGADVIKVEPVVGGDWARQLGIVYGDQTAYSITGNLGKRSLALDLKSETGKNILWTLAASAGVFMEGFRPGVAARLGFSYDAVAAKNPGIIYLSVSGFGQTGPLAGRPALDPALQALTGMMNSNKGEDDVPHRVMFIPVDMATGLYSFQALSSALYAKRDEEKGCYIDNSLMRCGLAMQSVRLIANTLEGGEMTPGASPHGVFSTSDGWITLVVMRNTELVPFCEAIERPDLADDPRFATAVSRHEHADAMTPAINDAMSGQPSAYWSARLTEAGIVHEILNDYAEFLEHPQAKADNAVNWLDQPGLSTPAPVPNLAGVSPPENGSPKGTAPQLGQHSSEILRQLGYDGDSIKALAKEGIIGGPDLPTADA
ncbi:MAG: CoA transferase [Rhodospirillaceae bacterium]|nr:CoA transferase [Rhodospirillaceae bacterium]